MHGVCVLLGEHKEEVKRILHRKLLAVSCLKSAIFFDVSTHLICNHFTKYLRIGQLCRFNFNYWNKKDSLRSLHMSLKEKKRLYGSRILHFRDASPKAQLSYFQQQLIHNCHKKEGILIIPIRINPRWKERRE